MDVLGLLFAAASALCNGSFGALSKIDFVKRNEVNPYLFNFCACCGVVLSGAALSIGVPKAFTAWGLLSGLFFVLSIAHAFLSINLLDNVAAATGVWCGVAMVVSFVFGVSTGDHVGSPVLAAAALACMLLGVGGITVVYQRTGSAEEQALLDVEEQGGGRTKAARTAAGVGAACIAGVFGGLILAPMHYAAAHLQGLAFVPSMTVGVAAACPISIAMERIMAAVPGGDVRIGGAQQWKAAALPGALAGVVWNGGNVSSILATGRVGLSVAYPIMQCGLFVAGAWGIVAFGELPGTARRWQYLLCGGVLIVGASLLSLAKG